MKLWGNFILLQWRPAKLAGGFFILCLLLTPQSDLWSGKNKPKVANPSKFKVKINLPKVGKTPTPKPGVFGAMSFSGASLATKASISVNILDSRFYPVKAYVIREVKKNTRFESLWDGRDVYGKESPKGTYYASLSISYSDGTKESKFFKFVKE